MWTKSFGNAEMKAVDGGGGGGGGGGDITDEHHNIVSYGEIEKTSI